MKVLIVGSGGREHAMGRKVAESPLLTKLYIAPGNPGMCDIAQLVPIRVDETEKLVAFVQENGIDMVLIGPEAPLMLGLADELTKLQVPVLGPSKAAAEIEGSKAFSKELMKKYNIPTGAYAVFDEADAALAYLDGCSLPIVVKADGLAAGKGVIIAEDLATAKAAVRDIMEECVFGAAGSRVVIEEFLAGEELSLLAFTDGKTVVPLVPSQDHKRIYDGDKGPNTGGMGAYAPAPVGSPLVIAEAVEKVLKPVVQGMEKEGRFYRGVLYAGLMVGKDGVKVLEFNARFGDPETQAVLPLLETDLLEIVLAIHRGTLDKIKISWYDKVAACIVLAAAGYPGTPRKGDIIEGLDHALPDTMVFHSGTAQTEGVFTTNGGRVLGVTALGATLREAVDLAYRRVHTIDFAGRQFRTDIGAKAFAASPQ